MAFLRNWLAGLGAAALAACAAAPETGPTVLAAASMQDALEAAADAWEAEGHARPSLSFSATPGVARQVADGAPADLVVLADRDWIDWLQRENLLADEPRSLATNGLVAVAPRDAEWPASLEEFAAASDGGRLAVAEVETVPAGRFAKEALERMLLWDAFEDRLAQSANVRVALALVERGEAPVGIVYASDALVAKRVRVVERLDPSLHQPITYYSARIAGSRHKDAEKFAAFLVSQQGRAIIAARGFGWP